MSNLNTLSELVSGDTLRMLAHGGGDGGADLVGLLDGLLATVTGLLATGGGFKLFPGIAALGSNVHPMIVHFPIALLIAFFALEVAGALLRRPALKAIAGGMLYLGAALAVVTAGAGLIAESTVPHGQEVHEIMEWHKRIGLTVTALALTLATWRAFAGPLRSVMARALYFFLAGLMVVLLCFGADLGGLMVYQYGVGVHNLQQADAHHHGSTEAESEQVP